MRPQPQLSSIDVWSYHERLCRRLLQEALTALVDQPPNKNENDLNRSLYLAIIRASYQAAQCGEHLPPVVPEGRNPPAASDRERAERETKIPDFYWAFIDPHASDPNDAAKQFVVECKRLTEPCAVYTREYVKSGIARFKSAGHAYGKGMPSGAMVGYLQGIALCDALKRVNAVAVNASIPPLMLQARDAETSAELTHDFVRSYPESPFHLIHLWGRVGLAPNL